MEEADQSIGRTESTGQKLMRVLIAPHAKQWHGDAFGVRQLDAALVFPLIRRAMKVSGSHGTRSPCTPTANGHTKAASSCRTPKTLRVRARKHEHPPITNTRRMETKLPRLAPLDESEWDDETRELLTRTQMHGRVLNIFRTLAHHPKLLKRWLVFGNHLLGKSTLPPRERELLILRIAWLRRAEYEWGQHVLIGKQAGLTDEEIERVAAGPSAAGWHEFDATLLRAVDELHAEARLSDATWQALAARYDTQQMLDLLFTVGQYDMLAMVLNSLGVQLDEGITGFPPAK